MYFVVWLSTERLLAGHVMVFLLCVRRGLATQINMNNRENRHRCCWRTYAPAGVGEAPRPESERPPGRRVANRCRDGVVRRHAGQHIVDNHKHRRCRCTTAAAASAAAGESGSGRRRRRRCGRRYVQHAPHHITANAKDAVGVWCTGSVFLLTCFFRTCYALRHSRRSDVL